MTCRSLFLSWLPIVYLCFLSSPLVADDEQKQRAERYVDEQLSVLQQTIVERRETDLRIKVASTPLFEALAVWEPNGSLMFPERASATYTDDYIFLRSEVRLEALLASTEATAWERYDVNAASLLYCQRSTLSVCAVINTDELTAALETSKDNLLSGIFPSVRSTFSAIEYLLALLLITVVITPLVFTARKKLYPQGKLQVTPQPRTVLTMGDMEIDPKRMLIMRDDLTANITVRDFKLLSCFAERPDEVLSKDMLYDAGWGRDFVPSSRALEQHIMTLRKKIDPERKRKSLIETVHGQGYRFPSE